MIRTGLAYYNILDEIDGSKEVFLQRPEVNLKSPNDLFRSNCARLNLGYLDPSKINLEAWKNRENAGILFVARAGVILYR